MSISIFHVSNETQHQEIPRLRFVNNNEISSQLIITNSLWTTVICFI